MVVGTGFETAARSFAKAYKSPHLRLLLVDDTVAHQGGDALMRMAKNGVDTVAAEWMNTANGDEAVAVADDPIERVLTIAGDPIGANGALFDMGATDGLPVIPPTLEMVERFVAASGRKGDEVIARLMPRLADITVERIAANAIMAGCTSGRHAHPRDGGAGHGGGGIPRQPRHHHGAHAFPHRRGEWPYRA